LPHPSFTYPPVASMWVVTPHNCFRTLTPPPCHSPNEWLMLLQAKPFPVPFLILVRSTLIYLPMKMEQTECSETSAYKIQTPGNYPKESIQVTDSIVKSWFSAVNSELKRYENFKALFTTFLWNSPT